jgi:hypothetical protein
VTWAWAAGAAKIEAPIMRNADSRITSALY